MSKIYIEWLCICVCVSLTSFCIYNITTILSWIFELFVFFCVNSIWKFLFCWKVNINFRVHTHGFLWVCKTYLWSKHLLVDHIQYLEGNERMWQLWEGESCRSLRSFWKWFNQNTYEANNCIHHISMIHGNLCLFDIGRLNRNRFRLV